MLQVSSVTKRYDKKVAVDGVSFSVAPGEVFGLLGPNGAGKTTIIRMIIDMMKPDEGTISIRSEAHNGCGLSSLIGYLPEERGLYQRLKVGDLLRYYARLKGVDADAASHRVEETLDGLQALDLLNKPVRELSKGMQQKVQLAMALINRPAILILDEPFSGLDPINRDAVAGVIRSEAKRGCAVILSTHLMNLVESICDRILLLDHGKAILHGPLIELKESFYDNVLLIAFPGEIPPTDMIAHSSRVIHQGLPMFQVALAKEVSPSRLLPWLLSQGVAVTHYERRLPTLDEIFVKAVKHE